MISWLPAAHIAERGAHYYLPVIQGVTVTICPDPRKIVEFLPAVKPTWFFAVPRIWEKLKAGLEAMLASLPDEQREPAQKGARRRDQEGPARAGRARRSPRSWPRPSPRRRSRCSRRCARRSASTRPSPSTSAPPRRPSRCSSSSTRSASRSASCGGCRRPAASPPATRPRRSSSARSGRRCPGVEVKLAEDGEVLVKARLGHARLPQHAGEERRDVHGGRLAADRRHRRARRGRLPEDRRPQEGADHQRGRQEHVAGEHRVAPEDAPAR